MKSVKIVIATLVAVTLMVTPIAMFAVEDEESDAAVNFAELSGIIGKIDFDKLMELDYSKGTTAENQPVSGVQVVDDYLYMNKNFIFDDNASIIAYYGDSLTICPNQTFSISTAGTGYGSINMRQGSHIYLVTNDKEPDTVFKTNIIADYEFEKDTTIYFNGKMGFTFSAWEFLLYANANTKITDSNTEEAKTLMEFPTDNSVRMQITNANKGLEEKSVKIGVTASLNVKEPTPQGDMTLKGNVNYVLNIESKTSLLQSDITFTMEGDNEMDFTIGDCTGTVKDKEDFTIKATAYMDESREPVTSMDGSISIELSIDNMDEEVKDADTGKVLSSTLIKNAKATYEMEFDNEKVAGEVDFRIGDYDVTVFDDNGDQTTTIDDLRFYGRYEGVFSFADISGPVALAAPMALTDPSSASASSSLASQYMRGIRPTMSQGEVKSYASEFFLGRIDSTFGFEEAGITTTVLEAEMSLGEIDYGSTVIGGLDLDLEISDSVGFTASASVDKVITKRVNEYSGTVTKYVVGDSDITLSTSVNGKSMFDCDFDASAEVKSYSSNGILTSNSYVKDLKGKITIGTSNKVSSITIGEVAVTSYGVGIQARNVEYDTEWDAFIIDKVDVSGDYYGPAHIRNVEGSYNNVMMRFSGGLYVSAESVDLRIYALNGDRMDYTRSYDSSKKVIDNNITVDGQMYLADVFRDDTLMDGVMAISITGAPLGAKEVFHFDGGVLVPGSYVTVSPISGKETHPGVTVSGKTMSVHVNNEDFTVSAPAGIYATTTTYGGAPTGDSGLSRVNGSNTTFNFTGASLGIGIDENGAVSYSLMALPGYELSKTGMTTSGITIIDCNEKTATISITGSTISCTAIPIRYGIELDGKTVKDDVAYGTSVTISGIPEDTFYIVDDKGNIVGSIDGTSWSVGPYYYANDLKATTVSGKTVTEVLTKGMNKVEAEAAKFTVPAGGSSLQFTLSSKVRFDLSGLDPADDVELIAQKTKYDGHDGFLIKAKSNGSNLPSTIYIPSSGTGKKLMHVDAYGRVSERQSEAVTVDGQVYLKTTTSDYSIFYEAADDSPVLPSEDNGPNWLLIGIGIAAGVAVVAIGAVIIIKRR